MRILEARFHPFDRKNPIAILMARLVWDEAAPDAAPRIEPSPALQRHTAPGAVMATLRHLVQMTRPLTNQRLQTLNSRFWSFVPAEQPGV
jgi:hypothetical protein